MQCPHTEHRLIVYVLCAFRLCQSNLRLLSSPLYLLCHLLHILNLAFGGKVLEEFTHKELPWLKAREGLAQNEPSTRIIDNNLIFEYYTSIKNKYNIVLLADIQSYIDKLW